MVIVKKLVWLIILLLCLEVMKTVVDKLNFPWSFLLTAIMVALQWFFFLLFVFYTACKLIFRRYFKQGGRTWVIVVSFFVLFGLFEGLFAWWLYHPAQIPAFMARSFEYYYYQYDLNIVQFDRHLATYNPRLFYTLKPGATGRFTNKEFNTDIAANSIGLRDDDASLVKPAVICLGDSYGLGWGVGQQETFAQYLEKLSSGKVLNAGMSSYGTARELTLLKQLDTSALTHLVIQYCSNDFTENKKFKERNYQLSVSSQAYYDTLVKRQYYISRYFPGKYFLLISQSFIKQQVNRLAPVFPVLPRQQEIMNEDEHARLFLDCLSHAAIDFKKLKVIVCSVGDTRKFGRQFLQQVQMLSGRQREIFYDNLRVADVTGMLKETDWFVIDCHLRPSGHRKMAQKIWEAMQQP